MPKYRYTTIGTSFKAHNKLEDDTLAYQQFMESYVARINDATFNVSIGGVRIGNARYSRLAQINLQTRIITFSRYAIENVPERGRRYLVLHELAHVHEASHNRRFWNLVAKYEPDYRRIGRNIQQAFKKNVERVQRVNGVLLLPFESGVDYLCVNTEDDSISTEEIGIISGGSEENHF